MDPPSPPPALTLEKALTSSSTGGSPTSSPQPSPSASKSPKREVKTVGGAFVINNPLALSFEELISVASQRPRFETNSMNGVHPLDHENHVTAPKASLGMPIAKEDWYHPEGGVYRLPLGKSNKRHMMYDICFSGQSVGLTLSFKGHVFVQALTGVAAKQTGIIAKGDIILAAACETGWIRCNASLTDLTDYIRANGRPVIIRFWRRPEPIQLGALLQSHAPLEIFLNFINRYLESPNYKEVIKNEQALANALTSLNRKSADEEDGTDMEDSDFDSDIDSNLAPSSPKVLTRKFLNTPMAQVMFLVEVVKIRQQASMSDSRANKTQVQNSIKRGVAPKYLQRRTSDFSIKDILKKDRRAAWARREVLNSGSLMALDLLYEHILELVRNDSFALFLHEENDLVKCLQKMGERNGWKLKMFSQIVRLLVPMDIVLQNRRCCYALLLYLLSQTKTKLSDLRVLSVAIWRLTLWTVVKYSPTSTQLLGMFAERVFGNSNGEVDEEILHNLVHESCAPYHRQFVHHDLGRLVSVAFNKAASTVDDESKLDEYMPRVTSLIQEAQLPENLVVHRAIQNHGLAPTVSFEEGLERNWSVTQGILFGDWDQDTPRVLTTLFEDRLPPQIERFFIPHGNVVEEGGGSFPNPLLFNFLFGGSIYGATLVCQNDEKKTVGLCIISEQRKITCLRNILLSFYNQHRELLCHLSEDDDTHGAVMSKLEEVVTAEANQREKVEEQERNKTEDNTPLGRKRVIDFSMKLLFEIFSLTNIVKLFECILLERKILMVSSRYSALTVVCESLRELIHPLQWCHVYAPVLPRQMLAHLECPTPFLIGINSYFAFKKDFPFLLDAVIVNLDEGTVQIPAITSSRGSDVSQQSESNYQVDFPKSMLAELTSQLRSLTRSDFQGCDSVVGDEKGRNFPTREVREVFERVMKKMLRHIEPCCVPVCYSADSTSNSLMIFDEESFLSRQPDVDHAFYQALMRTQALSSYVSSLL